MRWKDPTLLFDLEGVLIASAYAPVLHPQAKKVLSRAREDGKFKQVGMWTLVDWHRTGQILGQLDLFQYFDFVIAQRDTSVGAEDVLVWTLSGEQEVLPIGCYNKDLYFLRGDVGDKVLIDDCPKCGYPRERVVICESFDGEESGGLEKAYESALEMIK